jgi:hypothetical protein
MRRLCYLLQISFITFLMLAEASAATSYAQGGYLDVRVKDEMMSVDAHLAEIGQIMEEISQKAGFELSMSPQLKSLPLDISIADIDMERGIRRILNLANLRSFMLEYAQDGSISKLKVFQKGTSVAAPHRPQHRPASKKQAVASPTRSDTPQLIPGRRPAGPTRSGISRVTPGRRSTGLAAGSRQPLPRRSTAELRRRRTSNSPSVTTEGNKRQEPAPLIPEGSQGEPPSLLPEGSQGEPPSLLPEGSQGVPPPLMPEGVSEEPPPFMPEDYQGEPPPFMPEDAN